MICDLNKIWTSHTNSSHVEVFSMKMGPDIFIPEFYSASRKRKCNIGEK
jgi:hypothetical protein